MNLTASEKGKKRKGDEESPLSKLMRFLLVAVFDVGAVWFIVNAFTKQYYELTAIFVIITLIGQCDLPVKEGLPIPLAGCGPFVHDLICNLSDRIHGLCRLYQLRRRPPADEEHGDRIDSENHLPSRGREVVQVDRL